MRIFHVGEAFVIDYCFTVISISSDALLQFMLHTWLNFTSFIARLSASLVRSAPRVIPYCSKTEALAPEPSSKALFKQQSILSSLISYYRTSPWAKSNHLLFQTQKWSLSRCLPSNHSADLWCPPAGWRFLPLRCSSLPQKVFPTHCGSSPLSLGHLLGKLLGPYLLPLCVLRAQHKGHAQ